MPTFLYAYFVNWLFATFIYNYEVGEVAITEMDSDKLIMGVELILLSKNHLYRRNQPFWVTLNLVNTQDQEILLISHYQVPNGGIHYDNFQMEIININDGKTQHITFLRPRTAVARVGCLLKPNQALTHHFDLMNWIQDDINSGVYQITAKYHISPDEGPLTSWLGIDEKGQCTKMVDFKQQGSYESVWTGRVTSNLIEIQVE